MRKARVGVSEGMAGMPEPTCPLCTLKHGKIMLQYPSIICVEAIDENLRAIPGVYLVLPRQHHATVAELPTNWTLMVAAVIDRLQVSVGVTIDNVYANLTKAGGRTIMDHYHEFLVNRTVYDESLRAPGAPGLPNLGMVGLLRELAEVTYRLSGYSGEHAAE